MLSQFTKAGWPSQTTEYKTHTGPAVLIRPSLKHKAEVPPKTSYWDTELQILVLTEGKWKISQAFKEFQGRGRRPGWKKGRRGDKRGGLTDVLDTCKCPGIGTFPSASRKGGRGSSLPTGGGDQAPTFRSSEALQTDSCIQDQDQKEKELG